MILANLTYTARVLAAWWVIRQVKLWLTKHFPNHPRSVWFASVFLGAELTFVIDFVIFKMFVL